MVGETVFTVAKLNEYANRILSNDPRLRSIKVSGELSGFKRHSSGHLYFSLKDPDAVISCVMFRSSAAKLSFQPRDGMQVIVHGSVSIFPRDGKYQLYADGMRVSGEGELYKQFLLLKERLGAEGLFENRRPLPVLPRTIGVATSEVGAALHDIVTVTRRRFPGMNILLAPCRVQGDGAPIEIAAAVNALNRFPECDVIIVGRGGGSYEDLSCFNSETAARAIASSRVPVVSAVGHETDFTIADFAADLRAPTPSAAAELVCPLYSELAGSVSALAEEAEHTAEERLTSAINGLEALKASSAMTNPKHALGIMTNRLELLVHRADHAAKTAVMAAEAGLEARAEKLRALSPGAVLRRGYSIIEDENGSVISNIEGLAPDKNVKLVMAGGSASAVIKQIN